MRIFLRKPVIKALTAILCVIFLTVALVSGVCVGAMWATGELYGTGSLFQVWTESQMWVDASQVMYNYFAPQEPTQPWKSYYDGGIYTGEDSNYRYNIVDDDTGYSVLSTIEGGETICAKIENQFRFDLEHVEPVIDYHVVSDAVFLCDGIVYIYEDGYFAPLADERAAQYMNGVIELPREIMDMGFAFVLPYDPEGEAAHYAFDGDGFYQCPAEEEYVYREKTYTITSYVLSDMTEKDSYWQIRSVTSFICTNREPLTWGFGVSLALGLGLLVLLCCTAGRKNGEETAVVSGIFRIPSDISLVIGILGLSCGIAFLSEVAYGHGRALGQSVAMIISALTLSLFGVYILTVLCVRGKTKTLITGSVLYKLWCWGRKNARKCIGLMGRGLRCLPMIWKVMVCYLLLCVVEFFIIMIGGIDAGGFALWLLVKFALGALTGYVTMAFRRLKTGAEAISRGDYTTRVPDSHLVLDFKDTADTLNHIQGGMNAAVESRMKSERLKTELITNVSHDIKTPLTSIINYVDLLKKEPMTTENSREYLEVLDRQSARLKKLVEDLVEASKASTGNITVNAEAMDLGVVLGQALGEYSERLMGANLTPVVKLPETPAVVKADGRLLWRVFDNLLGNAVKYAMPGTRLYVSLAADSHAIVTIRNISREPLDITADELMERFVRGDASRHTEGSGLGLSIAKSLTESMGGEFLLSVDGDLFKAAVIFPLLPDAEKTEE